MTIPRPVARLFEPNVRAYTGTKFPSWLLGQLSKIFCCAPRANLMRYVNSKLPWLKVAVALYYIKYPVSKGWVD